MKWSTLPNKTYQINWPNQTYQTNPTKYNLPNLTYQTKPTRPNLPNNTTKQNLPNKTYHAKPTTPHQTEQNLTPRRTSPDLAKPTYFSHILEGLD